MERRSLFSLRSIFDIILLIALISAGFYFRGEVTRFIRQQYNRFYPCSIPIAYSIAQFDTDFGLSKAQFLDAIQEAEKIWEGPAGKELFTYTGEKDTASTSANAVDINVTDLSINLIYDYRQGATDKIQDLSGILSSERKIYQTAEQKYKALLAAYNSDRAAYSNQLASYQARKAEYDARVKRVNRSGGASPEEYQELNTEMQQLNAEAARLNQQSKNLQNKMNDVNAAVQEVNALISKFNLTVKTYNTIGASTGREFNAGEYIATPKGQDIFIYQFNNHTKLVRVLAHELGHALGLQHVEDPKAIMYRLNEGLNGAATTADIEVLTMLCRLEK